MCHRCIFKSTYGLKYWEVLALHETGLLETHFSGMGKYVGIYAIQSEALTSYASCTYCCVGSLGHAFHVKHLWFLNNIQICSCHCNYAATTANL